MEPRPPRPRSSRQFETPGTPPTPGIGERLYPNPADPAYYPEAYEPGLAAQPPLLPRQQRRQRRALRGIGIAVVIIALVAALGWFLRDTIRGIIAPPPPPPTVVAVTDGNVAAPGTPAAGPTSAALPNALATVTPTAVSTRATSTAVVETEAEPTGEAPAAAEDPSAPDRDISAQTLPLLDLLPTQDQVPAGMILADEAERSKAEVVTALGGTEDVAQLLDDWGWSGNAFRDFVVPQDVELAPGTTTFINASVHRFADAESAANALVVFSDYVIVEQGLQEVEAPAIGESARLLQGVPNGVPLAILYVQDGPIMYRLGASTNSEAGDPTTDVLGVATAIIPSQEGGG